jgi:hypothetical protein
MIKRNTSNIYTCFIDANDHLIGTMCPICTVPHEEAPLNYITPCNHGYHLDCLKEQPFPQCGICRVLIPDKPYGNNVVPTEGPSGGTETIEEYNARIERDYGNDDYGLLDLFAGDQPMDIDEVVAVPPNTPVLDDCNHSLYFACSTILYLPLFRCR